MKRLIGAATLAAMLAGCGGGGSGAHALPTTSSTATPGGGLPVSSGRGTATVIANATINAANVPALYARSTAAAKRSTYAKLRATKSAIASVEIDGMLLQGSASGSPVTNTERVTPASDGTIVVSETFSNVIAANNDAVIFSFYAVANDGSKIAIGELGTLVNVGSGAATTTNLGTASTQTLQVASELLSFGALSTYDIENTPALAANLQTQTAAQNAAVDAATGLYSSATLNALGVALAPLYERDLTITAAGASEFSIVYDYTQPDENALGETVDVLEYELGVDGNANNAPVSGLAYDAKSVIGAPSDQSQNVLQSPTLPAVAPQAASVSALIFEAPSTVVVRNVYGGHLIIGAHNDVCGNCANFTTTSSKTRRTAALRTVKDVTDTPYGATVAAAGEAPGAFAKTLTLANTTAQVQLIDPQGAAFGAGLAASENYGYFQFTVEPTATSAGTVPNFNTNCLNCDTTGDISSAQSAVTNAAQLSDADPTTGIVTATYDTWNAYNVPTSQIDVCSQTNCSAVSSTSPISVEALFSDPGTNPAVFGWTVTSGGTLSEDANGEFYDVTFNVPANNTAPISVVVSGTIPASIPVFVPAHPALSLNTNVQYIGLNGNYANVPTTITLTDSSGNTYPAVNSANNISEFFAAGVGQNIQLKAFSITFDIPASAVQNATSSAIPTTFYVAPFYVNGSISGNSCC